MNESAGQTASTADALKHMPQLDGLRTIAVGAVFLHHTPLADVSPIPLGGLGVRLFFVLSGFLITLILLNCRSDIDCGRCGLLHAARQFYIRRFLRIFPLYYFVIACAILFDYGEARQMWPWLVTYSTNIQLSLTGEWHAFSHFWSLAVEEHFYLVWPWLVLCVPRRLLFVVTLSVILLGPLYRGIAVLLDLNLIATFVATPGCLDTLGLGSLLALLQYTRLPGQNPAKGFARLALPIGAILTVLLHLSAYFDTRWTVGVILHDLGIGLVYVWVVHAAAHGIDGVVGKFLEFRPMTYLGRISYGLYVYHVFVPHVMKDVLGRFGWDSDRFGAAGWLLVAALTIAVASLSWFCFEQPLNKLKRWFPYRPVRVKSVPDGSRD